MDAQARLDALASAIGFPLPKAYLDFLVSNRAVKIDQLVSTNPEYLDVTYFFELGDGADYLQVDLTFNLLSDMLPPKSLPIAQDGGGNLYLIVAEPPLGSVRWWNHERELGDHATDPVAPDFNAFLQSLRPIET